MKDEDEIFKDIIWQVVDEFLIPKFNEYNMNASGDWLGSLNVVKGGNKQIIIKGADYTKYLVNGRANGKIPPISAIENWVNNKFGYYGRKATSVAFAVAKKIEKEGTSYYPNGTDLLEVLNSKECTDFINKKLSDFLTVQTTIKIKKLFKDTYK